MYPITEIAINANKPRVAEKKAYFGCQRCRDRERLTIEHKTGAT